MNTETEYTKADTPERQAKQKATAELFAADCIDPVGVSEVIAGVKCPWPTEVWPTSVEEAGRFLTEKLGKDNTTAISGALMRHGWNCAIDALKRQAEEAG